MLLSALEQDFGCWEDISNIILQFLKPLVRCTLAFVSRNAWKLCWWPNQLQSNKNYCSGSITYTEVYETHPSHGIAVDVIVSKNWQKNIHCNLFYVQECWLVISSITSLMLDFNVIFKLTIMKIFHLLRSLHWSAFHINGHLWEEVPSDPSIPWLRASNVVPNVFFVVSLYKLLNRCSGTMRTGLHVIRPLCRKAISHCKHGLQTHRPLGDWTVILN